MEMKNLTEMERNQNSYELIFAFPETVRKYSWKKHRELPAVMAAGDLTLKTSVDDLGYVKFKHKDYPGITFKTRITPKRRRISKRKGIPFYEIA
jgi:hypothetical protein